MTNDPNHKTAITTLTTHNILLFITLELANHNGTLVSLEIADLYIDIEYFERYIEDTLNTHHGVLIGVDYSRDIDSILSPLNESLRDEVKKHIFNEIDISVRSINNVIDEGSITIGNPVIPFFGDTI